MDYSNFKFNKPKSKKHKRETVSDKTYRTIYERDKGKCIMCGANTNLQLHHVLFRSEAPDKINDVTNCCMLCLNHHLEVHQNKHKWQQILQEKINKKYL